MSDGNDWTTFGFTWGPVEVSRAAAIERNNGTYRVLHVATPAHTVAIYVSPTGRSVRVFRDHKEMTVPAQ